MGQTHSLVWFGLVWFGLAWYVVEDKVKFHTRESYNCRRQALPPLNSTHSSQSSPLNLFHKLAHAPTFRTRAVEDEELAVAAVVEDVEEGGAGEAPNPFSNHLSPVQSSSISEPSKI